jgi:uncharacterized protein YkwD
MNRRAFLQGIRAVVSGTGAIALTGCTEGVDEDTPTPTPAEIPSFNATNAGIFSDIETLERAVYNMMNGFRVEEGYEPLGYNQDLAEIARYHSWNMARKDFFAHDDYKGRSGGDRADYFGYPDTAISENLFRVGIPEEVKSSKPIANKTIQGWKNSPSHRAGMLTTAHIVAGIGGYIDTNRVVFITAMYADIDGEVPT